MPISRYDAIVLGAGGVGSAALFHLAKRGARALAIDRFSAAHDRGSSHGQTRIIRQAYFEHPAYVPMMRRAYELWAELSEIAGEQLYHECGLIQVGPPNGVVLPGVRASARAHGLPIEELGPTEIEERWPNFRIPPELRGIFEQRAGYLLVERCVSAHLTAAQQRGATCRWNEPVLQIETSGDTVTLKTERGEYQTERLIVAGGSWSASLLADLQLPLTIRRKSQFWFCEKPAYDRRTGSSPTFYFETDDGHYYGFPAIEPWGVKLAEHSGGETISDPLNLDRSVDPRQEARLLAFAGKFLPHVTNERTNHAACMYTMSPDENFIVDRHPFDSRIVFAAGLSGHGFKFASMLGEALAQMTLDGQPALALDFLRLDRPALHTPG